MIHIVTEASDDNEEGFPDDNEDKHLYSSQDDGDKFVRSDDDNDDHSSCSSMDRNDDDNNSDNAGFTSSPVSRGNRVINTNSSNNDDDTLGDSLGQDGSEPTLSNGNENCSSPRDAVQEQDESEPVRPNNSIVGTCKLTEPMRSSSYVEIYGVVLHDILVFF